jgi:hypothetical protein
MIHFLGRPCQRLRLSGGHSEPADRELAMATQKRLRREGTLAADVPAPLAPDGSIPATERLDRMELLTMMG